MHLSLSHTHMHIERDMRQETELIHFYSKRKMNLGFTQAKTNYSDMIDVAPEKPFCLTIYLN